jgi:hypothetical protein
MISKGGFNNYVSSLRGLLREQPVQLCLAGNRHEIYFEDTQAKRRLGNSTKLRLLRDYVLMVHAQCAQLAFEGDQIEPAYTALSNWTLVEHDRKGVQIGGITYRNGKVSFISIQWVHFSNGPNRLGST